MQWEELTAPDFRKAAQETGVCIIAMGVIERHGDHLPLGTDFLNGHQLACRAAEIEPAVVFPPFYFGQIYEARCFPGTVTINPGLLIQLVQGVLDEIGRNGFKKVIMLNAHGGNYFFLHFLAQCNLWEEKSYTIYLPDECLTPERQKEWDNLLETDEHGHGCECESSITLANHPDIVKMDQVSQQPGSALKRLGMPPTFSGLSWYSNYPEHYAGDARTASIEKGKKLRQLQIDTLAEYIAAVKADQVLPALETEFYQRVKNPTDGE